MTEHSVRILLFLDSPVVLDYQQVQHFPAMNNKYVINISINLKNMSRTGHGQPFKFSTLVLLKGIVNLDFGTTMN